MSLRKLLILACLSISTACLGLGFWLGGAGWVWAVIVMLFTSLSWLEARRGRSAWTDSAALVVSVSLAGIGLVSGVLPTLMILAAGLALATWDLVVFDRALASSQLHPADAPFERKHFAALGLVLGVGLLAAVIGRMIQIQIPLGVMIVLVLLALIGLDRLWRLYRN